MIGSIASVRLKEAQVKELLTKKKTEVISGFVAKTGMKFDAPLKLTEEGEIAFDFPEKPKPEETTVPCPKCGKMLMKTQWRYECACGFKIWHTVAKVELSEEVMKELLTTGKTKQKIAGFTSKAGNTFDTCLKYEMIRFRLILIIRGRHRRRKQQPQRKQRLWRKRKSPKEKRSVIMKIKM